MNQGVVFALASRTCCWRAWRVRMFWPLPDGTGSRGSAKAAASSGQIQSSVAQLSTKPVVGMRQPPVPLVMRERPPVGLAAGRGDRRGKDAGPPWRRHRAAKAAATS